MYYLGIDIGTSSVKVLAINGYHKIVGVTSKSYPVYYYKNNWAEQNPEDWWTGTVDALKELIYKFKIPINDIESIGLSGQMHGLVILGKDKEVLYPTIIWSDQRTEKETIEIQSHFSDGRLRQYTGNKALTGFTAPKLLWLKNNHPDIYKQIHHIMLPKDYIRYKLTGEIATDVSDASGTLFFDVEKRIWSRPICEFLGIKTEALPKVYESYEVTGTINNKLKAMLGTKKDILVVGGGGDQAAGAIGTGTVNDGMISINLGTSGVVFASHEKFIVDKSCRLHAFCHANGKYHSMGVMLSAANSLKWWADSFHNTIDLQYLLKEAEEHKKDSNLIFLPYLLGERTPYFDSNVRGCFLGINSSTTRGEMTRAILEGVTFGLKDSYEIIKEVGIPIKQIRVIGGGSKSSLWKQILADSLDFQIEEINTSEGGGLGSAILAAVGAGFYKNVNEGCSKIIKITNTIMPIKDNNIHYSKLYKKYKEAYIRLKDWF